MTHLEEGINQFVTYQETKRHVLQVSQMRFLCYLTLIIGAEVDLLNILFYCCDAKELDRNINYCPFISFQYIRLPINIVHPDKKPYLMS
jgi:hypothetical protein